MYLGIVNFNNKFSATCVEFYIYTLFSSLWNWYEKINYLLHEVSCNEVYSAKTTWDRASRNAAILVSLQGLT